MRVSVPNSVPIVHVNVCLGRLLHRMSPRKIKMKTQKELLNLVLCSIIVMRRSVDRITLYVIFHTNFANKWVTKYIQISYFLSVYRLLLTIKSVVAVFDLVLPF